MKKKIFIGMAALFFAAITFYNVQVTQQDGDISLENVALMAQATGEIPPMGRFCTYGMQSTGDWNDVAVLCSNCFPLFGYKGYGDNGSC
jgi:hypothetical protein